MKDQTSQRELSIPTVTDRLIQQALLQVLQPLLDPTFSEHGYGFRPGRRAHDAVLAAQSYVQSGQQVVVDVDLEKFFDRVNHDILIDRLQKRIADAGFTWPQHGVEHTELTNEQLQTLVGCGDDCGQLRDARTFLLMLEGPWMSNRLPWLSEQMRA